MPGKTTGLPFQVGARGRGAEAWSSPHRRHRGRSIEEPDHDFHRVGGDAVRTWPVVHRPDQDASPTVRSIKALYRGRWGYHRGRTAHHAPGTDGREGHRLPARSVPVAGVHNSWSGPASAAGCWHHERRCWTRSGGHTIGARPGIDRPLNTFSPTVSPVTSVFRAGRVRRRLPVPRTRDQVPVPGRCTFPARNTALKGADALVRACGGGGVTSVEHPDHHGVRGGTAGHRPAVHGPDEDVLPTPTR